MQSRMPHTIQISSYGLPSAAASSPSTTRRTRSNSAARPAASRSTGSRSRSETSSPASRRRPGRPARSSSAAIACSTAITRIRPHRRGRRRRRLVPHRRHRLDDRRGTYQLSRPHQGHAQGRRRERRRDRDRVVHRHHPCVSIVAVVGVPDAKSWRSRRRSSSCGPASMHPRTRSSSSAGRDWPASRSPPRPLHRRVADVGHQDPEVPPPGATGPRARRSSRGQHLTSRPCEQSP